MIEFILILAYLWIFWGLYVMVMGLYRAHLHKRLTIITYILGSPFLIIGLIVDAIANIFIASVVFLEVPHEFLVTTRLKRYVNDNKYIGWRANIANYICDHLLDVFDPTDNHCEQK